MSGRNALAICFVTWAAVAAAANINVPADQPTIQKAISAAVNGDRVLVAPGTYYENINFEGKVIQVVSTRGAKVTAIDGSLNGTVVTFQGGETRDTVLSGFQIRNGGTPYQTQLLGGGILIEYASPTISDNDIFDNAACIGGGLMAYGHSAVRIVHNLIHNNQAVCGSQVAHGGAMRLDYAEGAVIEDNIIENNGAAYGTGGVDLVEENGADSRGLPGTNAVGGWVTVAGNIIRGNGPDGLSAKITRLRLVDNVIVGNYGDTGLEIVGNNSSVIYVVNNTIADNYSSDVELFVQTGRMAFIDNIIRATHDYDWSILCDDEGALATISNNLIYSTDGTKPEGTCDLQSGGLIDKDPLFAGGDDVHAYWLTSDSPAIDIGDNAAVKRIQKDASGAPRVINGTVDLGAYEFRGNRQ